MYLALKALHIAAVVLFLGNIYTGLFWKLHADATRDPHIIAHTIAGIIKSDRWFTVPGVFAIIAAGFAAAMVGDMPIMRTGWILWSIVLFSIAGVVFMSRVAPLQRSLHALAQAAANTADLDWKHYRKLSRQWELWGAVALITPVAALVIMVLKPQLPHF